MLGPISGPNSKQTHTDQVVRTWIGLNVNLKFKMECGLFAVYFASFE